MLLTETTTTCDPPPVALAPLQAPDALQEVGELVVVQARVTLAPLVTVIGPSEGVPPGGVALISTVGAPATVILTVTESETLLYPLLEQVIIKTLLVETVTFCDPPAGNGEPLQAPDAVHDVGLLTVVQDIVTELPEVTVIGPSEGGWPELLALISTVGWPEVHVGTLKADP